jgi:hypothetical protein
MAAKEIISRGAVILPKDYLGTNAERLALSTTDLKAGSTFYETDTKSIYIWDETAWNLM